MKRTRSPALSAANAGKFGLVVCCCLVAISAHGSSRVNAAFVPAFNMDGTRTPAKSALFAPQSQAQVPFRLHHSQQQQQSRVLGDRCGYTPSTISSTLFLSSSGSNGENNDTGTTGDADENLQHDAKSPLDSTTSKEEDEDENRRSKFRKRVQKLANRMVLTPVKSAAPMPKAIAALLHDATLGAVDMAVEEVLSRRSSSVGSGSSTAVNPAPSTASSSTPPLPPPPGSMAGMSTPVSPPTMKAATAASPPNVFEMTASSENSLIVDELVDEAFAPMEEALVDMEASLEQARASLLEAKLQAAQAMQALQAAALAQTQGAATIVELAEEEAERKVLNDLYENADDLASAMSFEDIDFDTSEMAPPFLDEAQCLIPGEPVVRVEKAPENSRRIFAGIDIPASVDDVWKLLTDYGNLQKVVPNLVVNEVLNLYDGTPDQNSVVIDDSLPEVDQCRTMAQAMKGSLLKQVGGAKVVGINFSARTTLEVREWPQGLPDFAHFRDEVWEGKSLDDRAKDETKLELQRYRFPRPFAMSSLPTKDISMQSILGDDGEFRMYQGVWRMQPLPGCAAPGKSAMRLTYAVEISPRAYLPVQLVEGRIVRDLCTNLIAIRNCVAEENDAAVPA